MTRTDAKDTLKLLLNIEQRSPDADEVPEREGALRYAIWLAAREPLMTSFALYALEAVENPNDPIKRLLYEAVRHALHDWSERNPSPLEKPEQATAP